MLGSGSFLQFFQVVRSSESATDAKKISHVVAKAAVVGMLLDGHNLDGVVPELGHSGKHVLGELFEGVNPGLHSCHPDMDFIDFHASVLRRPGVLELVLVLRIPKYSVKSLIGGKITLVSSC